MWHPEFDQRLRSWYDLRQHCQKIPLEPCLLSINDWWMQAPWRPYYLHWDDIETWPDPWELLADNIFCDLARALGIMYTIMLMQREDTPNPALAQGQDCNLVLVQDGKYILNWGHGRLLNIASADIKILKKIDSSQLQHLLS